MTLPGLAFFYGGLVQKKNLLATMAQVFAAAMVVTITWYMVGFSMAFGTGNPYVGNAYTPLNLQFALGNVHELMPTVPTSVFSLFQAGFAIITTALIVGAFAERMKFGVVVVFCGLWSVLIYAPVAHWIWMSGGWAFELGVRDFAGGMVVHVNAGAAALGVALVVGPRRGLGREPLVPSNLAFMLIGASLLWIGWFGFNGGSAGTAGAGAGLASVNTQIAAAVAASVYAFLEWVLRGQCSILGLATGAVAGLVAITPAAGYVMPSSAFILGAVGGVVAYGALAVLKPWLRIDDALDVFAIHGLVGIAGSVLTPVLVDPQIAGFKGHPIAELVAVVAVFAYSFVGSALIIKVIDMMVRVRVDVNAEINGLDLSQHGEQVV
jgi:Amt family ammonium transporter